MRSAAALTVASAAAAAGKPLMSLLSAPCDGLASPAEVSTAGPFTLRVTAAGAKGFTYTCDAAYDDAKGTADKECAGWLPDTVVSGAEDLDITLEALDAAGKKAVCMQWHLDFAGARAAGSWYPTATVKCGPYSVLDDESQGEGYFNMLKLGYGKWANMTHGGQTTAENTPATRKAVNNAYLDSMTYVSHRCVPKSMDDKLYPAKLAGLNPGGFMGAFPPGVLDPVLMRASHKILAISGVIHSIDRQCSDAWSVENSDSCVMYPWLHCHTKCLTTWNFGPGGIASWGLHYLGHHIPSPGINFFDPQMLSTEGTYGDLGCGGK